MVVALVGDCAGCGVGFGKGDRALHWKIDVHALQLNVVVVFFHATMKTVVRARTMMGMAMEPYSMIRSRELGKRYVVVCRIKNKALSRVARKKLASP